MSKGASVLLAIFIFFTFPLWIGLIAGGFGLLIGILGAIFGIIAGVFGVIFGGLFNWGWPAIFPHFHFNSFATAALIIALALLISKGHPGKKSGGK